MAFLGLEIGVGLSAALALAVLAALWRYSTLTEVEWAEITAGVMLFVTAAGWDILVEALVNPLGQNGLGISAASQLSMLVPALNLLGGLLVLAGGLRNSVQLLQNR